MPAKNDLVLCSRGDRRYAGADDAARKEMTIQDLWGILSRRRQHRSWRSPAHDWSAGAALFATSTRLYKGLGRDPGAKGIGRCVEHGHHDGARVSSRTRLTSNVTLQTQAQILQSDSLALQVIKELNLEKSPDFRPHFNPIGWVMGLFAPAGIPDPVNVPLEEAPGRRARVVKIFEAHLKVSPVSGTRLINIEYLSDQIRGRPPQW